MNSDTEAFTKRRDSFIHGISVRGVLAVTAIGTVCASMLLQIPVEDPLKTIVFIIGAYFFGNRDQNK